MSNLSRHIRQVRESNLAITRPVKSKGKLAFFSLTSHSLFILIFTTTERAGYGTVIDESVS
jgi:hypothetical protein